MATTGQKPPKRVDPLIGKKVGKLSVLKRMPDVKAKSKNLCARVLCQCDCGNRLIINRYYLVREPNPKTHCGCEVKTSIHTLYGPEYASYTMMKARCYDPNHPSYKDYGGRGIRVCTEWLMSFENFLRDMGTKNPSSLTLDRIDNDGNYEKDNCRWATAKQQRANQGRNPKPEQNVQPDERAKGDEDGNDTV